ncbi:hypothetical protein K1X13_06355 [Nocardioides sp. WL0053]|uniref:Uncharacterized protein n=1 Tax=Nocardioides jiangsuensis TaxID=2866161 RepID=A0ABS7RHB2_9ACTN|nr:hypothetical protein [Nocardioides jiangsuensis]MBY9074435.1 hypothetical protein [Nocardioides jiangsuensis]
MTGYAFNDESGELLVVWQTGAGDRAAVVTRVQHPVAGRRLAQTLSMPAKACWRTYHPAIAADPGEANSTAWRRAKERDAFDAALAALRRPHLP